MEFLTCRLLVVSPSPMTRILFLLATCLIAHSSFAQLAPPSGMPTVSDIARMTEASCLRQEKDIQAQIEVQFRGLKWEWAQGTIDSGSFRQYCSCLRLTILRRLSPEMISRGTEASANALMKEIGGGCAEQVVKPLMVRKMCGETAGAFFNQNISEAERERACNCTESVVNSVTGEAFTDAMRDMSLDLDDYRKNQLTSLRPRSLFPALRRCLDNEKQQQ